MKCEKIIVNMEKITFLLEDIPKIIPELTKKFKHCNIVTFSGPLGAGKTTLIKELLKYYGIPKDEVISPTFTYMNIYKNVQNKNFYHFDLYRIQKIDDFLAAGFDEYLIDKNAICLIEWPEVIEPLFKLKNLNVCKITLEYSEIENQRTLTIK